MTKATVGRYWHIVTLVVAVVALVLQLILILAGQNVIDASAAANRGEAVRRFLSYFTIQSNFLVAVSMVFIVRGRTESQVFRVVRLASIIGITVTGVVAAVALPPSPNYTTANLLCDRLLHIVVPLLSLVGWLVFGPRGFVRRADILPTLIWPVVWLVATLGLGPLVSWYPYPFLNVTTIGLGRALVNSAGVAILFLALAGLALYADGRLPGARQDDRATQRA
ncbi:Pr6Pr family membrane protein [Lapillicoccus sp.]|uniref:Pr6Pr family membrane protein n=1 Tax=Lapillicoccus sp. TaxID=1909287 RepID=UPI0025EC7FD1|nr:Pr6Pr family membrane protein [Lapillicoccus sp.]